MKDWVFEEQDTAGVMGIDLRTLVLVWWLLLASPWVLLSKSMTLEEFSVKEKKVQRLASDVLHNARDTDECGEVPNSS